MGNGLTRVTSGSVSTLAAGTVNVKVFLSTDVQMDVALKPDGWVVK